MVVVADLALQNTWPLVVCCSREAASEGCGHSEAYDTASLGRPLNRLAHRSVPGPLCTRNSPCRGSGRAPPKGIGRAKGASGPGSQESAPLPKARPCIRARGSAGLVAGRSSGHRPSIPNQFSLSIVPQWRTTTPLRTKAPVSARSTRTCATDARLTIPFRQVDGSSST